LQILWTPLFARDFQNLPGDVQARAERTIRLLAENPRHPSLRAKKMQGVENIWEASATLSYRITEVRGETLVLRRVGTHDILRKETT
jgi:mRNA-degrading endonuclease YafQ of YafQ-DinJ toxin-antitoxin module